jgi:hypothetical protein
MCNAQLPFKTILWLWFFAFMGVSTVMSKENAVRCSTCIMTLWSTSRICYFNHVSHLLHVCQFQKHCFLYFYRYAFLIQQMVNFYNHKLSNVGRKEKGYDVINIRCSNNSQINMRYLWFLCSVTCIYATICLQKMVIFNHWYLEIIIFEYLSPRTIKIHLR